MKEITKIVSAANMPDLRKLLETVLAAMPTRSTSGIEALHIEEPHLSKFENGRLVPHPGGWFVVTIWTYSGENFDELFDEAFMENVEVE